MLLKSVLGLVYGNTSSILYTCLANIYGRASAIQRNSIIDDLPRDAYPHPR